MKTKLIIFICIIVYSLILISFVGFDISFLNEDGKLLFIIIFQGFFTLDIFVTNLSNCRCVIQLI